MLFRSLLLSPNMGRERDGAETEVEPEMAVGYTLRQKPVPQSTIDFEEEEGSDYDWDAFRVDVPNHDIESPLETPPPSPPERELPGARSASVSDAEDTSRESSQGIGEADRAARRKRQQIGSTIHRPTSVVLPQP